MAVLGSGKIPVGLNTLSGAGPKHKAKNRTNSGREPLPCKSPGDGSDAMDDSNVPPDDFHYTKGSPPKNKDRHLPPPPMAIRDPGLWRRIRNNVKNTDNT